MDCRATCHVIGEAGDIQPARLDDLLPEPEAGMNGEAAMKLNGHPLNPYPRH
jgi:hypothetical protein